MPWPWRAESALWRALGRWLPDGEANPVAADGETADNPGAVAGAGENPADDPETAADNPGAADAADAGAAAKGGRFRPAALFAALRRAAVRRRKLAAERAASLPPVDVAAAVKKNAARAWTWARTMPARGWNWFATHRVRFLFLAIPIFFQLAGLAYWYREKYPPPPPPLQEDLFRQAHGAPLVRIAYISDWPSSVASAYLAAEIIRTRHRAEVLFKPVTAAELPAAWTLLATGKADVFMSCWLPSQAGLLAEAGEKTEVLGELTPTARLGLAVPAWMPLETLADLAAGETDCGGVVYGIDPGSRLNSLVRRALEDYDVRGLAFEEKSEQYMLERLREAMRGAKPVVVAAWTPHAVFGEYRLKFLADPRGVFGGPESVRIVATRDFAAGFERICGFLRRVRLGEEEFCDLVYRVRHAPVMAEEVKKWIADHAALVEDWEQR